MPVDRTGALEASTAASPSARREAKTQQIEQGNAAFSGPGRVGRRLQNRQLRCSAQDGLQDLGRLACRADHGRGAVWRELIRGPTLKGASLAIPQGRRKRPGVAVLARHRKALAIRGCEYPGAPRLAQGPLIMGVDQGGKGRRQGLCSPGPRRAPGPVPRRDVRAVRHRLQGAMTGRRHAAGIEMGEQRWPQRLGTGGMHNPRRGSRFAGSLRGGGLATPQAASDRDPAQPTADCVRPRHGLSVKRSAGATACRVHRSAG